MPKLRIKNSLTIDSSITSAERASRLNKKNVINLENLVTFNARPSPGSSYYEDLIFLGNKSDLYDSLGVSLVNADDMFYLYSDAAVPELIGLYSCKSNGDDGIESFLRLTLIGKFN